MPTIEYVLSCSMLSAFIWGAGFLLPKAAREHNGFGVICSLLTAIVALFAWLFIGIRTHSR